MLDYEIILNFNPEKASKSNIDAICEFADKYDALYIRKRETDISRMYISTEDCINLAELSKGLKEKMEKEDKNNKILHVNIY